MSMDVYSPPPVTHLEPFYVHETTRLRVWPGQPCENIHKYEGLGRPLLMNSLNMKGWIQPFHMYYKRI